jgi:hypothetical protein
MARRLELGSIPMTSDLMLGRELAKPRVSWEQRAKASGQ